MFRNISKLQKFESKTHSMKPKKKKNGRAKGSSFERRTAAQLTTWTGTRFSRVPMSGGWNQTGDVTPKDPREMVRWPFNIECKNAQCWHLSVLFEYVGGVLPGCFGRWWKQCSSDAKKSKRIPVLVFTRNHRPVYCMMQAKIFLKLGLNLTIPVYIRAGKYRVFLWKELLAMPYKEVIHLLGVPTK